MDILQNIIKRYLKSRQKDGLKGPVQFYSVLGNVDKDYDIVIEGTVYVKKKEDK